MKLTPKTPWHLWVVGVLSLLWNLGGVVSYTSTKFGVLTADRFPAEQLDYYYSFPAWATAFWALGVWGCFLGSLALLLRSRKATLMYVVSIVGLIGTTVYQWGLSSMPASLQTSGHMLFAVAIWLITIALYLYARAMSAKNVLR